jgi:hypothetical protein
MNSDTTLFRQIHPKFIPDGQMTSQAFVPFPQDNAKLSVYDGDQISAAEAYRHYTETLTNKSEGVWGVTCSEVSSIALTSQPDPLPDSPHHAVVDFAGKTPKACRGLAKRLRDYACARGCLHSR